MLLRLLFVTSCQLLLVSEASWLMSPAEHSNKDLLQTLGPVSHRREPTPPEVKEQRERERELMELDRDIRTIFAYNLPLKAGEKELFQFFASAGKIVDVRIIMDRNTRKSKGFAYIEFANRVSLRLHRIASEGSATCSGHTSGQVCQGVLQKEGKTRYIRSSHSGLIR